MLTYGEAMFAVKDSMRMVKGEWVTCALPKHEDRMKPEEASKYYNKKLFDYWTKQVDSSRNKEIVSALMFGHTDAYKKRIDD